MTTLAPSEQTKKMNFERHPELAARIEQLANAPLGWSTGEWSQFLALIDSAIPSEPEQSALSKLEAGTHVLVPVEPTEIMTWEGSKARKSVRSGGVGGQTMEESYKYEHRYELAIYRAMLQSSQEDG